MAIKYLDSNGVLYLWQKLKALVSSAISNKVDKVNGKGLSANDYTTAEKEKLAGIEAGANKYMHPDSHPASMISGLDAAIQEKVAAAGHLKREIAAALPEPSAADGNTIYMIRKSSGADGNLYDEYMLIDGAMERLGDTAVDMTGYVKESDLAAITNGEIDEICV